MRNVLIEIQYDGTDYFGWQRQAGFRSVQQDLEEAIEKVTGEQTVLHGSGRTDTGVHALRQMAHFQTESALSEEKLLRAINSYLPEGVAVTNCQFMPARFHARFDVCSKRYLYLVRSSKIEKPVGRPYVYWVPYVLDLKKMREAAAYFLGKHDFRSFAGADKTEKDSVRVIYSFKIFRRKDRFHFFVEGDGFLLHMVRTMVGTLIEVGRQKIRPIAVKEILEAKDRRKAGPNAPAHGLFLLRVKYASRSRRSKRKKS